MSTGGIFTLITNTGLQDRILIAADYLQNRIDTIVNDNYKATNPNSLNNSENIQASWLPDINEIEKTHVSFINNSFKPFIPIGYEYSKTLAQGGSHLGTKASFIIPQFGDFTNDMVLHIKLTGLRANDSRDRVRYTSMLGHKLLKKVEFIVKNNPIDEYTSDDYNAHYEYKVPPNKKRGWLRNIGQEIPELGYLTGDPTFDLQREYKWFGSGPQTPKQRHDTVEMWIPIILWCREVQNSLPNFLIPYGETELKCTLATASEIVGFANYGGGGGYIEPTVSACELYVNHIFLMPEIHAIFMRKFGFSLIRVHRRHKIEITRAKDKVLLSGIKWPIEAMYISVRPRANLALSQFWNKSSSLSKTSIRVPSVARDPAQTIAGTVSSATTNTIVLISAGLSTTDGAYINNELIITGGIGFNPNISENRYRIIGYNGATLTATIQGTWALYAPGSTSTFEILVPVVAINDVIIYKESPSIDTLELRAHDIDIFKETPESFFNSYLPYRFGDTLNTPEDRGWYTMNFNFYPGQHQPSGYLNVSKSREFYLKYTSSVISPANSADLIVLADALNFLIIKDSSMVLKYST
jgi:hypothetical protein